MARAASIAVIGGGIGGLTAAQALLRRGFDVTVYEAAPELKEIGAGVALGPNAMKALRSLDLEAAGARRRLGVRLPVPAQLAHRPRHLQDADEGLQGSATAPPAAACTAPTCWTSWARRFPRSASTSPRVASASRRTRIRGVGALQRRLARSRPT